MAMRNLTGCPGTVSGLVLRIGQFVFASVSVGVMISASQFSSYTAFCYLTASMGLQMLWSFGLVCLDLYILRIKRDIWNPVILSLFVVGDMVTATLTLAAACSSAGLVVLFSKDLNFCKLEQLPCDRLQISVAAAFISWVLIAMSSHVMFWILFAV